MKAHVDGGSKGLDSRMTRHPSACAPAGETQTPWSEQTCVGTTRLPLWPEWSHQSTHADPREIWGPSKGPEQWPQPQAHPLGGGVSTSTSTNAMGCRMTQPIMGTVCDHAEHIVAGSARHTLQIEERPWVDWTQAITAEPTLGTFLPSVCSSVSLSCICNYFKKCTEFGLKTNHQNGSQHRSKSQECQAGLTAAPGGPRCLQSLLSTNSGLILFLQ